jgi:hypothetical protein
MLRPIGLPPMHYAKKFTDRFFTLTKFQNNAQRTGVDSTYAR